MPFNQILVLGDSITEFSTQYKDGICRRLSDKYARKLDVILRGYSGYTTTMIRGALPLILNSINVNKLAACVVFIGTNDAVLPGNPQHVDLSTTIENINAILKELRQYTKNIVLITPGIIDESKWEIRSASYMLEYTIAMLDLDAKVINLADLFNNDISLLSDGLHFTNAGYERLMPVLESALDELLGEVPLVMPNWRVLANKDFNEVTQILEKILH